MKPGAVDSIKRLKRKLQRRNVDAAGWQEEDEEEEHGGGFLPSLEEPVRSMTTNTFPSGSRSI